MLRNAKLFVFLCLALALAGGAVALGQTAFPLLPNMSADADGSLHWSKRSIPLPALASAEGRKRYVEILNRHLAVKLDAAGKPVMQRGLEGANAGSPRDTVLKAFPVNVEETTMGGVKVSIYTAKDASSLRSPRAWHGRCRRQVCAARSARATPAGRRI